MLSNWIDATDPYISDGVTIMTVEICKRPGHENNNDDTTTYNKKCSYYK